MASVTKNLAAVQPLRPSSSSAAQAEDESWKKNTDCVYFLASPLTCKKGIECEYRHSESARFNPRDCWYWTNSVCLNPNCPFRHPPLDGLLEATVAVPGGTTLPSTQAVSCSPHSSAKQGVSCIFFQKGYCLKGDGCRFLHGSIPTSYKVPQVPAAGGIDKYTQQKIIPQANFSKLVEALPEAKASSKVTVAFQINGASTERYGPPTTVSIKDLPNKKEPTAAPINNGNTRSKSSHFHQAHHSNSTDDADFQNDKSADQLLRESSPGFDVLVDDGIRDADFYLNEDHFASVRGRDVRNLNGLEIGHPDDYDSVDDVDPEMYHDPRRYESYEHLQEKYAWEQHGGSSDRSLREAAHGSVDDYLHHHLSKRKRVNGLRSVVNPDYGPKRDAEERNYQNAGRNSFHSPPRENSLSSRLHGRIKLPRRSPVYGGSLHQEMENDRGRNRRRLSPCKPQFSSHHGRFQDRLRGRIQDDLNEGKTFRDSTTKRGIEDNNDTDFAGPKSLAELKVSKQSYGKKQQMKHGQPTEGNLSFEGPKPLSEILKRKREAEAAASGKKEEDKQIKYKRNPVSGGNSTSVTFSEKQTESQITLSSKPEQPEAPDSNSTEQLNEGKSSQAYDLSISNNGEGLAVDGVEDHEHELEENDRGNGDYEYDRDDGEDCNLEDGENADPENDYMDEDDGDDFAKKIGVMFS
ncbi:hypothetical protein Nepgr_008563 [Nepenthes gracilis]|uniref:C3H1-type domain-containing protein n=1 Tax=Nepenthes gracilis TaxID=150966 RepID=A0AAD3S8X4_NEPGR|nr:hypothetical protein Nepgr_008563 [Nepenthes gracilis]